MRGSSVFKDVREMSLLRSMAANASNSFEGAWSVVSNNKVFLLLFVVAIALILMFFWYTDFIKLRRQKIIRSIASSLSTTAFVFFVGYRHIGLFGSSSSQECRAAT